MAPAQNQTGSAGSGVPNRLEMPLSFEEGYVKLNLEVVSYLTGNRPARILLLKSKDKVPEIPVDWDLANVVPVFRKGREGDPGNYRPDSLTSVTGESMERIIVGVIEKHLKDNSVDNIGEAMLQPGGGEWQPDLLDSVDPVAWHVRLTGIQGSGRYQCTVYPNTIEL
ncbi:hypothetical protein BTVI_09768 [Pitangus sulphuratus]|nr:hypothetical protein BTVI_09768 [Pitangus sulphuratus]